jgi:hypothetical protein
MDIEVQGRSAGAQAVNQVYLDTARLLIQVAPPVFADKVFALKGGTAINLFVRDMPRLSVDLDLVFVDHRLEREDALAGINEAIRSAVERLKKRGFQTYAANAADAGETKLFVRRDKLEVKVEVNFVMRGTLHPVRRSSLTPKARETLLADLELPWSRSRTSTAESSSPPWIGSIRAICSTSCSSFSTKASRRESGAASWRISRAITGRFTRCFSRSSGTSPATTTIRSGG